MNTLTLNSDGSVYSDVTHAGAVSDALCHLGDRVLLADGYCLRSFFRMLECHPSLQRLSEFFPGLMERYRMVGENASEYRAADLLEFGKTVEMIGFPGEPRLEIYNAMRSVAGDSRLEIRSIDLPGLLAVPLQLGKLRHIIFGDRVDVFEFETAYSLFEFIDGIAWELGFHTTPGQCEIRR